MIQRTITSTIKQSLEAYPVTVITGARQVGKSTVVYTFTKSHGFHYVSLDNIEERNLANTDPKYFIERHGYPLIIDEVQYAPILMEVIEEIVNSKRIKQEKANGLFILTGSQSYELMNNISQSMAGRAAVLTMEPLSQNEINEEEEIPFLPSNDFKKKKNELNSHELFERIIQGNYPEIYSNPAMNSEMFYQRYVSTYIDRDVNQLINLKDKSRFHSFMQILASLTGQQLNMSTISKAVGVTVKTIGDWISVLETCGLIYLLQSYNDVSIVKRITRTPKIYFSDTGLAAHLAKINDASTLEVSAFAGAFMETYVMNEIRKTYLNNGKNFNGYYYRDSNQNEIDLILLENAKLHLIEIKKGISFNLKDVSSFKQLEKSRYEIGESCIICNTKENYSLTRNIKVISVNCI